MPWFAIDDGFDTHPKVRKAGNAAAGLFCRLGAHCTKHLTEGLVDGVTARSYGTAAQLRKLVDVGMLHADGHGCQRCQQPEAGGYVLHDFLDYNRSRKQIETARENGRKRQNKGREQQRQQRSDAKSSANRASTEPQVNLGSGSNATQNETRFQRGTAGQSNVSRRDTLQGDTVVPSPPIPSSSFRTAAKGGGQPAGVVIPDWAQPLVDALSDHDIDLGWRLSTMQWAAVQELINTRGVPFLVEQARRRWNPRDPIKYASLLIQIWCEIPAPSPRKPRDSAPAEKPPHCGDIDCDPIDRYREIETPDGLRLNTPCPQCHPSRKEPAA
jgi:hypothetical protein